MLSFKNFILNINEGLIKTVDVNNAIEIVNRSLIGVDYWHSIEKYENLGKFSIKFEGIIPSNIIEGLFGIINNLGYFCSYIELYKGVISKKLTWKDIPDYISKSKNCNGVKFMFESKFDELLQHKPNLVYHVCKKVNINKILKIGLSPKSKSKKSYHPERIYVSLHLNTALKMLNNFRFDDIVNGDDFDYDILEIDLSDSYYSDIKLFKDPNFVGGYYTYQNFRPKDIKILS